MHGKEGLASEQACLDSSTVMLPYHPDTKILPAHQKRHLEKDDYYDDPLNSYVVELQLKTPRLINSSSHKQPINIYANQA